MIAEKKKRIQELNNALDFNTTERRRLRRERKALLMERDRTRGEVERLIRNQYEEEHAALERICNPLPLKATDGT